MSPCAPSRWWLSSWLASLGSPWSLWPLALSGISRPYQVLGLWVLFLDGPWSGASGRAFSPALASALCRSGALVPRGLHAPSAGA